jgi:hypothetical protein
LPKCLFWNWKRRKTNQSWRKKLSYLQNTYLFFLLFGPLLLSKLISLSFLLHLKWSLNYNNNRTTYKEVFGCSKTSCGLLFCVLEPPTLKGRNFFISNPFFTILMPHMHQKEGFNICFDTIKKEPSPWI